MIKGLICLILGLFLFSCNSSNQNNSPTTPSSTPNSIKPGLSINIDKTDIILDKNPRDQSQASAAYHSKGTGIGILGSATQPDGTKYILTMTFLGKPDSSGKPKGLEKGFKLDDVELKTLQIGFQKNSTSYNASSEPSDNTLSLSDTNLRLAGTFQGSLVQGGNASAKLSVKITFNFDFPDKALK